MLNIENLTFGYRRKKPFVFEDFSLEFPKGGIYGLLGENGAGKSTLIYLMLGLLTPTKGRITLDGTDVRRRLPNTINKVFLVPESYYLPDVSLNEYVSLNASFYPNFSEDDLKRYLDIFNMGADVNLHELSMGQQKKVLMSFALATHTPYLFLDEPTNGLDIPSKSQFRKFISTGTSEEQTILISTHQVRDVEQMLDHIIIIGENRVLLNETSARICQKFAFVESADEELTNQAIYYRPTFNGNELILANKDEDDESRIDLELLFNGVLNEPQRMSQILSMTDKINKEEKV
jgi:ABC-2 type transport system ATP-binding protein